jgi:hypothetical protein
MKNMMLLEKIGIKIPVVTLRTGTEEEVQETVKKLNEQLSKEYEKILQHFQEIDDMNAEKLNKFQLEINTKFVVKEKISDVELYHKLHKRWFELNQKYFELFSDKLETGCDEYDMDYSMRSTFHQLLHESPEKRRERLEKPIDREMEKLEADMALLDDEISKVVQYYVEANEQEIIKGLSQFYTALQNELQINVTNVE